MSRAHQPYVPVRGERPQELIDRGISEHDFQEWLNALNGENHWATILKQSWGQRPPNAWESSRTLRIAVERFLSFREASAETQTGRYLAATYDEWPQTFARWPEVDRGEHATAGVIDYVTRDYAAVRHVKVQQHVVDGPLSLSVFQVGSRRARFNVGRAF